jgi:hypothetical protein
MKIHPLVRACSGAAAAAALILMLAPAPPAAAGKAPPAVATPTGSAKQTALQRIQRMAARLNAESSTPEGEEQVVTRLAAQLRVSADSLRSQKRGWGVGYGEVAMIYGFARSGRLQVVPERVLDMRRSGMDWQAIANDLGVKVDAVATRMNRQQRRVTGKADSPAARAATAERK